MAETYFDDYDLGAHWTAPSRTLTQDDVDEFLRIAGFRQELFVPGQAADEGVFGRAVVPGPFTLAVAIGMTNEWGPLQSAMALLSIQYKAIAPAFAGDTITTEIEVSAKKKTSKSDRGVMTFLHTVTNQEGRAVASFNVTVMVRRRPEPVPAEG